MGYIALIVQLIVLAWIGTSYASGELPQKPKVSKTKGTEGQEIRLGDTYCSYNGERITGKIYGFTPSDEMQAALEEVKRYSPPSEFFFVSSTVSTIAMAQIADGQKFILYNPEKFNKAEKNASTGFLRKGILAHEVGHLQLGHLALSKKDKERRHHEELMADRYSGMVLKQLGATLAEALAAVELAANTEESETHPNKESRKAAVASGWERPQDLKSSLEQEEAFWRPTKHQHQVLPKPRYARLEVENDPEGEYFVGPDNDIFKVSSEGDVLLVGEKIEVWSDAFPKPMTGYKVGGYYANAKVKEPFFSYTGSKVETNYTYTGRPPSGPLTGSSKSK
jgi:hypothetical protein